MSIPYITTTPTVLQQVQRMNGTHSEAALRAALRQAGIPPEAPYADWCAMIGRALTLLDMPPRCSTPAERARQQ